jgi:rubrerythrin
MANLKGSQTEQNLLTAFAGESQARNRYTYFASKARSEGLIQIAQIFEETANQEKEHAKRFFQQLDHAMISILIAGKPLLASLAKFYLELEGLPIYH